MAHNLFADNSAAILAIGGFAIGFTFGAIVLITNFCTMGAIADAVALDDYRRLRSWILASAVALAGAQTLSIAGIVNLDELMYLRGGFDWLGSVAGGLIFGFGMVLAGGCPSRNLVRAGAGDLRALTTLLVMALFAYVTMGGLLGPVRQALENSTAMQPPAGSTSSIADMAAHGVGLNDTGTWRGIAALLIAGSAFGYCFGEAQFRSSARHVFAGVAVGACAIAGWVVTALARDDFALVQSTPASISFVRPVADSFDYLMRFTAMSTTGFNVALVFGSLLGALVAALATGRFQIAGFADPADTKRNLAGAALMGIGGVLALGCSIGQGVTGISTMAAGSFLAFAAMASGAVLGVKYLDRQAC